MASYVDAAAKIAKAAKANKSKSGGGLKLPQLGGITALKDLVFGLPLGLAKLAAAPLPGGDPAGEVYSRAAKTLASGGAGFLINAPISPLALPGINNAARSAVGSVLGEEYKPKSLKEQIDSRGIIPTLVENLSWAAGGAGAAGKLAKLGELGRAAEAANAAVKAGELAAVPENLAARASTISKLEKIASPYKTIGREVLRPATKAAEAIKLGEAAGPGKVASAVGRLGAEDAGAIRQGIVKGLAKAEEVATGFETKRLAKDATFTQEMDKRKVANSPEVGALKRATQKELIGKQLADGTVITPELANKLVGNEVRARLEGISSVTDSLAPEARQVVESKLGDIGALTKERIPQELLSSGGKATPLGAAIDSITEHMRTVLPEDTKVATAAERAATEATKAVAKTQAKADRLVERAAKIREGLTPESVRALAEIRRIDSKIADAHIVGDAAALAELDAARAAIVKQVGAKTLAKVDSAEALSKKAAELRHAEAPGAAYSNKLFDKIGRYEAKATRLENEAARIQKHLHPNDVAGLNRLRKIQDDIAAAGSDAEHLRVLRESHDAIMDSLGPQALAIDEIATNLLKDAEKARGKAADVVAKSELRAYHPLYAAVQELFKDAETNKVLGESMPEISNAFTSVVANAKAKGFDPKYIAAFTDDQVKNLVYNNVRLGSAKGLSDLIKVSGRKTAFAESRGFDSLLAAINETAHVENTNALLHAIKDRVAVPYQEGVKGFTPFKLSDDAAKYMVPDSVANMLRRYSATHEHAIFAAMRKVTNPWRTFMLTLSPRWYVNNVFGNLILAKAEGVKFQDFTKAWASYKLGTKGKHWWSAGDKSFEDVAGVLTGNLSSDVGHGALFNYPKGVEGLKLASKEGVGTAAKLLESKMTRANEAVDDLVRAAVYHKGVRTGLGEADAALRAQKALVNYLDLDAFERDVVRSIIPFYAWQKSILKMTAKFPIDHPALAGLSLMMDRLNEDLARSRFGGEVPEGYKGLLSLPGIGNLNTKNINPFQDAWQLASPEGIANSVAIVPNIFIRKAFGAPDGFATHYQIDEYGNKVPTVSAGEEILQVGAGLPQVRAGAALANKELMGRKINSRVREAGKVVGVPTYTDQQVRDAVARLQKNTKNGQ